MFEDCSDDPFTDRPDIEMVGLEFIESSCDPASGLDTLDESMCHFLEMVGIQKVLSSLDP